MEKTIMNEKLKIVLLIFTIGLLFISCAEENSTEPEKTEAKQLNIKTIDVPAAMKQVSDPKASATVAYVSLTNGFQAYTALFQVPQGANSTGDKFTWTRGSLSITMYYEEGDNLTWKLVFTGSEDGTTYDNWIAMEASQSADEKNGWMKIYEDNSTVVASEWSWTTDSNGKYSFVLKNNDGESLDKIEIISNPDLSGELYFYTDNLLTSKTTWDKDGNGQWWEYDEEGNIVTSGSWSASAN